MAIKLKNIISISEARKRIFEISDEVQKTNHPYTLTENGRPKVVMMSASDYDSWLETMDILQSSPDLSEAIEEFENDKRSGKIAKYKTLEQVMADIAKQEQKNVLTKTTTSRRTRS